MNEQYEKMKVDVLESIAWKDLDDGVTALDIDSTTEHLHFKGYRKQSEWISVEDRLPEKGARVLCYLKFEPESPDVICQNLYHGGRLWLSDGSKVTHWMPLPEPPKMKGGE